MNKRTFIKAACLLLASTMAAGCFAACAQPADPDVTVTVTGGTGGGTYKEGDECTVTATVPEGSEFVEWQVYGLPVSTANPYTFEVDFDIELKAVFSELPKTQYTVTVNGGMIGEDGPATMQVAEGAEVTVYPDESQARKFRNWLVAGEEITDNPYTFTVTGNTEITAEFDEFCMISVSGGTIDGERSKIVPQGSEITVKAGKEDGREFVYWYTLDENFAEVRVSDTPEYTFKLNDSVKIYAKFLGKFNVTVINGTVGDSGESAVGVLDGETVVVTPNAAPEEDEAFIGWYIGGERVSTDMEYELEVTNDIAVEAKYGPLTKIQLAKPDSSKNTNFPTTGLIFPEAGGSIALDRLSPDNSSTSTMFQAGVEYVRYDIYDSPDADASAPLGSFRLRIIPGADPAGGTAFTGYIESADGSVSKQIVRGGTGNFYINITEVGQFHEMLASALGYSYCAGQPYYFAATAVGPEYPVIDTENDTATAYISSERSEITTSPITVSPGQEVAYYDVKVIDGYIGEYDGEGAPLTQVRAGVGAKITVTAQMPEDDDVEWVFLGWKEVTYGEGGEEILGDTVSSLLTYTFSVTRDITVKPVFENSEDVEVVPLVTPDNSDSKLMYVEGGGAVAFDRAASGTMFTADVAYIVIYIYDSTTAMSNEYLGQLRMTIPDINDDGAGGTKLVGSFSLIDGSSEQNLIRGKSNDYYVETSEKNAFLELIRAALGENYVSGSTYYFAFQAVPAEAQVYSASGISAIGTNGITV